MSEADPGAVTDQSRSASALPRDSATQEGMREEIMHAADPAERLRGYFEVQWNPGPGSLLWLRGFWQHTLREGRKAGVVCLPLRCEQGCEPRAGAIEGGLRRRSRHLKYSPNLRKAQLTCVA